MSDAIDQSRKLAELLNKAGIEVNYMISNEPIGEDIYLTENLMVLMDAGWKLGIRAEICPDTKQVKTLTLSSLKIDVDGGIYPVKNNNWQYTLCSALVEAIFKKLGETE